MHACQVRLDAVWQVIDLAPRRLLG